MNVSKSKQHVDASVGTVFYVLGKFKSMNGCTIDHRLILCLEICQGGLVLIPAATIKPGKLMWITSEQKFMTCPKEVGFRKPTYLKLSLRCKLRWNDYQEKNGIELWTVPVNVFKPIAENIKRRKISFKAIAIQFMNHYKIETFHLKSQAETKSNQIPK